MHDNFRVSVIIPVFNREMYIEKAIESAILLNEVGEIVIIDDGSTDNTLKICSQLRQQNNKIVIYQHNDKKNHGVSESRNIGIQLAKFDFIAFLDSDDYYLPNRFLKDKELFFSDSSIDGVYNALGIEYYTNTGREKFYNAGYSYQEFLTVSGNVPPNELFFVLFNSHLKYRGDFSTDTITIRKNIFEKVGYFNPQLKQKEDIHLWTRMAAKCKLVSGNISEPVAIRGIHDNNTMTNPSIQPNADLIWWKDLNKWMKKEKIEKKYLQCFRRQYLNYKIQNWNKVKAIFSFFVFFVRYPQYLKVKYGCFDIYFYNLFGRNTISLKIISFKNRTFN